MLTHTRTLSVAQKAGWGLADMGIVVFVIVKPVSYTHLRAHET